MAEEPKQADDKPVLEIRFPQVKEENSINRFCRENKDFLSLFFKGGTYLALLLILYLLGQMSTLQLIGWAEEHCPNPNVQWAGSPWDLTYRNLPNISTTMGMDNGGKG